ncbi:transketolase [Acidisphaera rubrifaciens]|uniref:Transketolase n=1 Tax=Acidisphaera rubrifaciens HS-AP3 TaxID=1231350 RepID=A0A0D6P604_9PROT|nr:transketolase [Acidisphaera rubrifaciens]GAN76314.1 transketolase [Acidisphaera rubrifaciens HS-AP3]
MDASELDRLCINTIRTLAIDAIQKARSGHPGTPMGMAPVAYSLWQKRLDFDPADPIWPNRDRFVLSSGHASMLLYALLHLTGTQAVNAAYQSAGRPAVTLDDIKTFRQLGSACPGHPEYHITSGVEATTGPLGQGVAMSVGMAIAERWLASHFNRPDFAVVDWRTYALCGDGCMMEGISGEAASLAGHLGLHKLCWIYDSNRVTIEGHTGIAFTEDVATRFLGFGWNVLHVRDANDANEVLGAFDLASRERSRPTLIIVESHIGYGAPHKQDSPEVHGEPLGDDEVRLTKRSYGWPEDAQFLVPDGVYRHFADGIGTRGAAKHAAWRDLFARYRAAYPDLAGHFDAVQARELPAGWDDAIPAFPADAKGLAGRDASAIVENAVARTIPWLIGGAADLAPSTKTRLTFDSAGDFQPAEYGGRNLHFGIREHAMGAAVNGMALAKLRPFGAGFLIFSDYMRTPIRLSAIMELPALYVFTHDSIGVGEDGPTHQPVEQLAGLRAIPGLITLRPCDANEVAEAWRFILSARHQPACLILSRQPLPTLDRNRFAPAAGVARGAYVLADFGDTPPRAILIGTGSEVSLCVAAATQLASEGIATRVVSMPSWELFERQHESYRDDVLPDAIRARVAVEQAATIGWERYVGRHGAVVGMHTFGASAPLKGLLEKFGFTPEHIVTAAREQVARQGR